MISLHVKFNGENDCDVIAIRPKGFKYFEGDCLREWVNSGRNASDYNRRLGILHISDINDLLQEDVIKLTKPCDNVVYKNSRYLKVSFGADGEHVLTLADIVNLTAER